MTFFLFFLRGSLCELSIFPRGGFLSPPSLDLMLVTFLYGWAAEAFLRDVVVLGVIVWDWALFSLGPLPFLLVKLIGTEYYFQVTNIVSMSA
jgi:hypothetical protein